MPSNKVILMITDVNSKILGRAMRNYEFANTGAPMINRYILFLKFNYLADTTLE